jgi:predicted aminopeptidase
VVAARQFAVDSLGLQAAKSFTTFSQLDRDTLVLVLSAAYPDRLERKTWSFPDRGPLSLQGLLRLRRGEARRRRSCAPRAWT